MCRRLHDSGRTEPRPKRRQEAGITWAAIFAREARARTKPANAVSSLVEVDREDWSFGIGAAELA